MNLTAEQLVEMQRRMLRIRAFDERAADLLSKGMIPGVVHTSIGHEAAVVGGCMAVRDDDYMVGYHRSHSHPIGKGAKVAPLMAELFGRSTGICHGKGGSMHLADFSVGSLGESGIVAAGMPIAVGAALGAKLSGQDRVCLCFFGDGAANAGPFHEAINLASIWKTPVIFICENNEYAVTFSVRDAMMVENVADRAAAYGIPGVVVDGQDVLAVHTVVSEAVVRARSGDGPTLIEAKTYRYHEHSVMALKFSYRPDEEIERWRARDPVALFRQELIDRGALDPEAADRLEVEIAEEIEGAITFAQNSPLPNPEEALEDVWASGPPTPRADTSVGDSEATKQMTYLEATMQTIGDEMRRDPTVFVMGEDVREGLYGSIAIEEFADDRIRDTPISEAGFVGAGVGAALTGLRPVIQMGVSTFLYSAMDQVINQAAKLRYMSGGQASVPLVLLAPVMYRGSIAAHHSDRPYALFANSPGLKIAAPSTPYDMKGLMAAAIRADDPVIVFADTTLWGTRGQVPEGDYTIPFGLADVKREGTDVTLVAIAGAVGLCLSAADKLEEDGVSVEVVDPRSLVPLDYETITGSVAKTGRLVVVDAAPRTCGFAGEIVATVAERCELLASPARVTGADVPTPFSPPLERFTLPDAERVVAAVRGVVAGDRTPAAPARA
jgi:TPP-dependent pyruvate/acetoin dehydrogenase alpha subunit/pyruvate/2-oxoglutarate/acetoin dehydrogenase E1 component